MSVRAMVSLLTVLSLPALANDLSDPTRPPASWQVKPADSGGPASQRTASPRLTSILVSPSRRVAVIDGVALREGQSANGIVVVRIGKTWVDARVSDTPVRLSLSEANVTKEPR